MDSPPRTKLVLAALALALLDLFAVVGTGGVSLLGPVGDTGVLVRVALCLGLVGASWLSRRSRPALHGYVALLLLLVPLLHFRGYRLRGDGLWYYSYAHSIAFDLDLQLENQYQRLGIDDERGSQLVRETGRARYTFPVGAPLAWVPWIWLGHGAALLSNLHGVEAAYDGFSDPYFHVAALGNLLFGWLGLLVLHRFVRRWFSPEVSFVAVASIATATFLGWYLTYHALYTHALTFLLVSAFLWRWTRRTGTLADDAVLGLLLGAAACVRWQNAVFGLVLARPLLERLWRREWRPLLVFGACGLAGILPQLVSWKVIFDRFYIGVPLGEGYMRWADPFVTEILFSSRHGLLSWSPILWLAVAGFLGFARRQPRAAAPLAVILVALTYVNSAVADWWAGGSFGARRFDSLLPIFALGLASSIDFGARLVRRRPLAAVAGVVVVFALGNVLLMEQLRKGRIPVDDTMSWQAAAEGALEDTFDYFGYPFSFPMNWSFARRYDRPLTQYDILVGKYLFHRMNDLGGVIDLGPNDPAFLGNGWSGLRDGKGRPRELRHAVAPRAGLFIPTDRAERLRFSIECSAPPGTEPVAVEVWLNGRRLGGFFPTAEPREHAFTADASWWRRINLLELVATSGEEGREFLAVDRLRFERLDPAP